MAGPLVERFSELAEALDRWARDEDFPFLFASDPGAAVGQLYGAFRERSNGGLIDNRTVFVIDAGGQIGWRAAPFREIDPTAYEELGAAIERIAPPVQDAEG